VAEGAAERATAVRLPETDPALLGVRRHQPREGPFEEGRGDLGEVAHPLARRLAVHGAGGVAEADAADPGPVAAWMTLEELEEGALALVVDDDVDERIRREELVGPVGDLRPAEDD